MNTKGLSNQEVFDKLWKMIEDGETVTYEDLMECVSTRSVVDYIAKNDAITVFFSGEDATFIENLSSGNNTNIRIIRRTEASKFLADDEFSEILRKVINKNYPETVGNKDAFDSISNKWLYDTSTYDGKIGTGFWNEISRKFAADTKGDAYSLCTTAGNQRIFEMEELPAWLKNAADDAKMGGYTKAELMGMGELDRFAVIKDWITEDMKNTQTYLDGAGNKIGQSFDNSSIEKHIDNVIPDNYASEMNSNDYIKHKYEQKASSNTEGTATGPKNGEDSYKNKTTDSETVKETQKEVGDSKSKQEAKEAAGDSESKQETKEETGDSESKQEVKKEIGDSETEKGVKDKLDESTTKQDTSEIGKETNESSTNHENFEGECDFENKKSNTDATKADSDTSAKKSELTDGLDGEHTSDNSKVVDQTNTGGSTNTSSDGSSTTVNKDNTASDKQTAADGGSNTTVDKADIDSTNQTTMDTSAETKKSEHTGDGTENSNTNAADSASKAESKGDLSNSEGNKINSGKDISDIDKANGNKHTDLDIEKNGVDISKNNTELSDKSKKFINDVEEATGSKVDTNFSSKTVRKINKALDIMDKVGDIMDLVDAAKTIWNAGKLFKSGNEDEAGKVLRDYGFSTLGGMVFSVPLGVLAGAAAINPLLTLILVGIAGYYGSQMGEFISDLLGEILGLYDEAGAYTYPVDPLIFDLNGDGVKTVTLADGVHFDFDKNGFAEKIGWVSAEDGLLVRDLDKNGKIDSGRELMGDLTELSDEMTASNGFEAPAYFDANADGVVDAKDDIYNELQIWQDKNQNGVVDDGELMSLSEAGIASINLAYENIDVRDGSGNGHSQRGTYTKTDGTTSTVEDVWFGKDAANTVVRDTIDKNVLEETDEIAGLPDIQGKGNQYSLHQAILRDETGTLKKLVEDYIAETDSAARKAMLPELIYVWTGVNDVEVTSRGSGISDARKLAALEVITGRKFNSAYGSNPVQQAGVYLEEAFTKLVELYYGQLEMQTTYAQEYAELYMNIDFDENGNVIYDISSIAERYMAEYDKNPLEGRKQIFGFVDSLRKTGMDSLIGKEVVYGKFAITNSDLYHVIDYQGDDVITGSNADDILIGEIGNDILRGEGGNDTYIFNLGDGEDTIVEGGGTDRIVFGEGIAAEDIFVSREDRDLYLTNRTSGDRIKVKDFFYDAYYFVDSVEFADGTKWSIDDLQDKARYYYGTDGDDEIRAANSYYYAASREDNVVYAGAGNDTVYGNNGDDTLYGEEGNDILYGGNGNDVLNGGKGADILYGENGNDTYVFNLGDGEDTIVEGGGTDRIVFGEGILAEDIFVTRQAGDLYLTNRKSKDRIKVKDFFNDDWYKVESFHTSDGRTLDYSKINIMIQAMASFEDSTGMMWEDAVEQKNEQAQDLINQWWVKEAI